MDHCHELECEESYEHVSKKRKIVGRMSDVRKKLLASSHEIGPDCQCTRYACFNAVADDQRKTIINAYNELSVDEQNAYLSGLMTMIDIDRHRPRSESARNRSCTFSYRVRVMVDEILRDVPVCSKAFISLHGITKKKLEIVQGYLKNGQQPKDGRGKHTNRQHRITDESETRIVRHIASFKGRKSHYGLAVSKRLYLPEELNVSKMQKMLIDKYPQEKASYETYRTIFNSKFNISFGYPRMDTCSTCDQFSAEINSLESKLKNLPENSLEMPDVRKSLFVKNAEQIDHVQQAQVFYHKKTSAREKSKNSQTHETIAMDYGKNLHVPNITTNDVYYNRQLNVHFFNIHVLSNNESYFYAYDQTVANKGADEVTSFLYHFIDVYLSPEVTDLEIFCDSCAGQNKNWTVIRFLHYIVHYLRRLESVRVIFPVRGHSYLECDRNMVLINQKEWAEMPQDWFEEFRGARMNPSPFVVVEVDRDMIKKWTDYLGKLYTKKCPIATRPIKEFRSDSQNPLQVEHRSTYGGHWRKDVVTRKLINLDAVRTPGVKYTSALPITAEKFDDLQKLKSFCGDQAKYSFSNLPKLRKVPRSKVSKNNKKDDEVHEIDDEDFAFPVPIDDDKENHDSEKTVDP